MSLLMDALRKAEADKKAASARATGTPAMSGEETAGFARSADELRLEPLGDLTRENLGALRGGEYPQGPGNISQRLSTSGRFRQQSNDATIADELSLERPAPSAELRAGTLTRPELVTPHTVFAATHRRRFKPLAAGLGALLLLVAGGLALFGYRYYRQVPVPIAIPSPRVALEVETTPVPEAPGSSDVTPVAAPVDVPLVVLPPFANLTLGTPAPGADSAHADVRADMQAVAAAAPTDPPAITSPTPALPARDFEMRNGDMRIARSTYAVDRARRQLTVAYTAFESGDLPRARREYLAVLNTLPQQRDAQLGLGAIALAENRLKDAHRHYAAVLTQAPDHPLATAAMFLIEGGRGSDATETKLKLLLDRGVEAPYLQFALGNLYAREQRWGDAQQAFFAAFRGQPRNADYVFNLAVSLDQLGQRKAALDYYQQAQALRGPMTNFDGAVVAARIATLAAQ